MRLLAQSLGPAAVTVATRWKSLADERREATKGPNTAAPLEREDAITMTAAALQHPMLECVLTGCSTTRAFDVLFSDGSVFMSKFKALGGGDNLDCASWRLDRGVRARRLTYVQAIKSRFSPVKSTRVEEVQHAFVGADGHLMVCADIYSLDVPFAQQFYVRTKWTLKPMPQAASVGSMLIVSMEVAFTAEASWLCRQIGHAVIEETTQRHVACAHLVSRLMADDSTTKASSLSLPPDFGGSRLMPRAVQEIAAPAGRGGASMRNVAAMRVHGRATPIPTTGGRFYRLWTRLHAPWATILVLAVVSGWVGTGAREFGSTNRTATPCGDALGDLAAELAQLRLEYETLQREATELNARASTTASRLKHMEMQLSERINVRSSHVHGIAGSGVVRD
jgi:hypothetical protein